MERIKKLIVSLLIVLSVVLAFVACSNYQYDINEKIYLGEGVKNESDLEKWFDQGGYFWLNNDVTITHAHEFDESVREAELDLRGHKLIIDFDQDTQETDVKRAAAKKKSAVSVASSITVKIEQGDIDVKSDTAIITQNNPDSKVEIAEAEIKKDSPSDENPMLVVIEGKTVIEDTGMEKDGPGDAPVLYSVNGDVDIKKTEIDTTKKTSKTDEETTPSDTPAIVAAGGDLKLNEGTEVKPSTGTPGIEVANPDEVKEFLEKIIETDSEHPEEEAAKNEKISQIVEEIKEEPPKVVLNDADIVLNADGDKQEEGEEKIVEEGAKNTAPPVVDNRPADLTPTDIVFENGAQVVIEATEFFRQYKSNTANEEKVADFTGEDWCFYAREDSAIILWGNAKLTLDGYIISASGSTPAIQLSENAQLTLKNCIVSSYTTEGTNDDNEPIVGIIIQGNAKLFLENTSVNVDIERKTRITQTDVEKTPEPVYKITNNEFLAAVIAKDDTVITATESYIFSNVEGGRGFYLSDKAQLTLTTPTSVSGTKGAYIYTNGASSSEGVTVTINGDLTVSDSVSAEPTLVLNYTSFTDNGNVTITGSVNTGIAASNSTFTVNGSVIANGDAKFKNTTADISGNFTLGSTSCTDVNLTVDASTLTVTSDTSISGTSITGSVINIKNTALVTINKNLTVTENASAAIINVDTADMHVVGKVTLTGNAAQAIKNTIGDISFDSDSTISGIYTNVIALSGKSTTLTNKGNVTVTGSTSAAAIDVTNEAELVVNGALTVSGTSVAKGINVNNATVRITSDTNLKGLINAESEATLTVGGKLTGNAGLNVNGSTATVTGITNVTGGAVTVEKATLSTYSLSGSSLDVNASTVTVTTGTNAFTGAVYVHDNSALTINGKVTASTFTVTESVVKGTIGLTATKSVVFDHSTGTDFSITSGTASNVKVDNSTVKAIENFAVNASGVAALHVIGNHLAGTSNIGTIRDCSFKSTLEALKLEDAFYLKDKDGNDTPAIDNIVDSEFVGGTNYAAVLLSNSIINSIGHYKTYNEANPENSISVLLEDLAEPTISGGDYGIRLLNSSVIMSMTGEYIKATDNDSVAGIYLDGESEIGYITGDDDNVTDLSMAYVKAEGGVGLYLLATTPSDTNSYTMGLFANSEFIGNRYIGKDSYSVGNGVYVKNVAGNKDAGVLYLVACKSTGMRNGMYLDGTSIVNVFGGEFTSNYNNPVSCFAPIELPENLTDGEIALTILGLQSAVGEGFSGEVKLISAETDAASGIKISGGILDIMPEARIVVQGHAPGYGLEYYLDVYGKGRAYIGDGSMFFGCEGIDDLHTGALHRDGWYNKYFWLSYDEPTVDTRAWASGSTSMISGGGGATAFHVVVVVVYGKSSLDIHAGAESTVKGWQETAHTETERHDGSFAYSADLTKHYFRVDWNLGEDKSYTDANSNDLAKIKLYQTYTTNTNVGNHAAIKVSSYWYSNEGVETQSGKSGTGYEKTDPRGLYTFLESASGSVFCAGAVHCTANNTTDNYRFNEKTQAWELMRSDVIEEPLLSIELDGDKQYLAASTGTIGAEVYLKKTSDSDTSWIKYAPKTIELTGLSEFVEYQAVAIKFNRGKSLTNVTTMSTLLADEKNSYYELKQGSTVIGYRSAVVTKKVGPRTVEDPRITLENGELVKIQTGTSGASIFYTVDYTTTPTDTVNSLNTTYSKKVQLDLTSGTNAVYVAARATLDGYAPSKTVFATFTKSELFTEDQIYITSGTDASGNITEQYLMIDKAYLDSHKDAKIYYTLVNPANPDGKDGVYNGGGIIVSSDESTLGTYTFYVVDKDHLKSDTISFTVEKCPDVSGAVKSEVDEENGYKNIVYLTNSDINGFDIYFSTDSTNYVKTTDSDRMDIGTNGGASVVIVHEGYVNSASVMITGETLEAPVIRNNGTIDKKGNTSVYYKIEIGGTTPTNTSWTDYPADKNVLADYGYLSVKTSDTNIEIPIKVSAVAVGGKAAALVEKDFIYYKKQEIN